MSQHDFNIANQTAPNFRSDLNNALAALASLSSGTAAPAAPFADMLWYETDTNTLWKRNEANSAWISLGTVDETNSKFEPNQTFATQAEAQAATNNTKAMTPLRVLEAINANGGPLDSGSYNTAPVAVTNISGTPTNNGCQWMRVGNCVTVSGSITTAFTSANTASEIGLDIPIASNFAIGAHLGGVATPTSAGSIVSEAAAIIADGVNNRAKFTFYPSTTGSRTYTFSFTYRII